MTLEVGGRVESDDVTGGCGVPVFALVVNGIRHDRGVSLEDFRGFDEDGCKTGRQMPIDMTMEEPGSRVIGSPSQYNVSGGRDGDRISSRRVLVALLDRRVDGGVVRGDVEALGNDLEFVSAISVKYRGREDDSTYPCKWKGWKPASQLYTVN